MIFYYTTLYGFILYTSMILYIWGIMLYDIIVILYDLCYAIFQNYTVLFHFILCYVVSGCIVWYSTTSYCIMLCCVMLRYVMSCYDMLCYVMLCYVMI